MPLMQGVADFLPTPVITSGVVNATSTGASRNYQIAAFNAGGVDTPLSSPYVTGAINASTPDVTINWLDIPGAAGYRVIVNGTLLASVTAGVNTYRDNAGTSGATYVAQTINPLALGFVANAPVDGQKWTYAAAKQGLVTHATANVIASLTGSASKTIRVVEVGISALATTILETSVQLKLRTTADSGGTSTGSPTAYPYDQNAPAATGVLLTYTADPTVNDGTTTRTIRSAKMLANIAAPTAASEDSRIIWTFGNGPSQAVVLRGIAQQLDIDLGGVTIAGPSVDIYYVWTEE